MQQKYSAKRRINGPLATNVNSKANNDNPDEIQRRLNWIKLFTGNKKSKSNHNQTQCLSVFLLGVYLKINLNWALHAWCFIIDWFQERIIRIRCTLPSNWKKRF